MHAAAARALGRRRRHALQLAARRLQLRARTSTSLTDPELEHRLPGRLGVQQHRRCAIAAPAREDDGDGADGRLDDETRACVRVQRREIRRAEGERIPSTRTAATAFARTAPTSSQRSRTTRASRSAPQFTREWVQYLVQRFGERAARRRRLLQPGQRAGLWQWVHIDVHPDYPGYDDLASLGISYATTIKSVDPDAKVSGPVDGGWMGFFYSPQDWRSGWNTGPGLRLLRQPGRSPRARRHPVRRVVSAAVRRRQPTRERRLLDLPRSARLHRARRCAVQVRGRHRAPADAARAVRAFWDPRTTSPTASTTSRISCRACATGSRATTPTR